MFIEKKEMGKCHSLREQFLNDLNKEIRIGSYKKNEKHLRKSLIRRIEKGELF